MIAVKLYIELCRKAVNRYDENTLFSSNETLKSNVTKNNDKIASSTRNTDSPINSLKTISSESDLSSQETNPSGLFCSIQSPGTDPTFFYLKQFIIVHTYTIY